MNGKMVANRVTLVADIGGTNARFALIEREGDRAAIIVKKATEADDYPSIADAVRAFLAGAKASAEKAIFAVAAPVTSDEIVFTNSPWRFSQRDLARQLGLKSLQVVNDFAAMARGAVASKATERSVIKEGKGTEGAPVAVLGPGTGLGLGIVFDANGRKVTIATQGGFAAFAPQNEREFAVWNFLRKELSYISFEHVLSGRGLVNLYRAVSSVSGSPAQLKQPEEVTAAALARHDAAAREAAELFCAIVGTFAGDASLIAGARGGVILAGGILPRIEPILRESEFVERFGKRDQMSDYMRDIPVSLLKSADAALIGASLLASGN